MKTTLVPLLVLSLFANIIFAVHHFRPAATAGKTTAQSTAQKHPATAAPTATLTTADSAILNALDTRDPDALIAKLTALGLSPGNIHIIATGLELQNIADELDALKSEVPYWRPQSSLPLDTRKRISELGSSLHNRISHLLPHLNKDQYEFLAPDRRAELRRLELDYDDLTAQVRSTSYGFRLKSDFDDLNILIKERKREIDEFFTPDERALHDLRHSPVARLLQNEYGNIIENENEYQNLHAILQNSNNDKDGLAQIDALLGPERLAALARLNDPDAPLIQTAVERLNLPAAETTAALAQIRAQARQATDAITNDTTLTLAQKKAALKNLAAQSQQQMTAVLGDEGAHAFSTSSRWMGMLRNGLTFTITPNGTLRSRPVK